MPHTLLQLLAAACMSASLCYVVFAVVCVSRFRPSPGQRLATPPPVTILKPICGLDAGLRDNLRSFCDQDYPSFQIIFGVASPTDPAIPVIEGLIREFPDRDLRLCVDPHTSGLNLKVSNLANMYPQARHDLIVIADSDMRVCPNYLNAIVGAFKDPAVGAATCLYTGAASGGVASMLGAAFINEWFLPSVLVAQSLQPIRFCFGATMAVRRELLDRIGGFASLAPLLADDYMLGKRVSDLGYKIHLPAYLVENVVEETSLRTLFLHELRWARTVRTVQPYGYMFSFVTYPVPVALMFLPVAPSLAAGLAAVGIAISLRLLMHHVVGQNLKIHRQMSPWLVPLRDLLCFAVWGASFLGRQVRWRDQTFAVKSNGDLTLQESQAS